MADISKIRLENETYDIKDATARTDISNINNEINLIEGQDTIFLGDSYAAGTTFEHGEVEYLTSWCEYLRQIMGLTAGHYYIFAQGNAGFAKIGNNSMNFQMTLASHINEITDKNVIKNIFVCAGYNDNNEDLSLIVQRIQEFIAYCKQQFPNATVYIGMIGGNSATTTTGAQIRERLVMKVLHAYQQCNRYGGVYLGGIEQVTHNFYIYNNQGNHPNESGYLYIAQRIYNAWKQGYATIVEPISNVSLATPYNNATMKFQATMQNNTKIIYMSDYNTGNFTNYITTSGDAFYVVPENTINNNLFKSTIDTKSISFPVDVYVKDSSDNYHYFAGILRVHNNGGISLHSTYIAINHPTIKSISIWGTTITVPLLYS